MTPDSTCPPTSTQRASAGRGASAAPVVSVGLPVHNGQQYIDYAIRCVRAQTLTDMELIISDNASTDDTERICRAHASEDPRIRYFRHEVNRGAAFNFNFTVDKARGPFFKWIAHDDGCEPRFLERCVAALEEADESVVLCHARSTLIDEQGEFLAHYGEEHTCIDADRPHDRVRQLTEHLFLCTYVFGVMRTEVLRQTSRIGPYVSSDIVLLLELALRGKLLVLPEFLDQRRVHDESSRRKHHSARELAAWFDTKWARRRVLVPPRIRYACEALRAIARAPLPLAERIRCVAALTLAGARRRFSAMTKMRSAVEEAVAERARA
ncbi:MAG: glycosyltransferase family 2 protein [Planctomycetota bacterium]|nr:MAG: glycosyltransferase family 2 protein [Planctomycetota bacterium]